MNTKFTCIERHYVLTKLILSVYSLLVTVETSPNFADGEPVLDADSLVYVQNRLDMGSDVRIRTLRRPC